MSLAPTAAFSYLGALLDYLRLQQRDPREVLGTDYAAPSDRDARISEYAAAQWFQHAADALQDDALGLHVGEQIRPGHYGVLGYAVMACATLGEAMRCQQRYQALVLSIASAEIEQQGEALCMSWHTDGDASYRQLAEFNFAAMLSFMRWLAGQPLRPIRVDFTFPAPAQISEHRRVFGCPLRFAQDAYRVVLPGHWQTLPLIQPDPAMQALMDRLAAQQLSSLQASDDTLARARALIARSLSSNELDLPGLAAQLQLSSRTLQRKLQDSGISFTQLLDSVRAEMAQRFLADRSLSLTDIAFLLGYSEQSAFTRAYRRWTGSAPTAARQ